MSFPKSEMQRIREVMAADGYKVTSMHYIFQGQEPTLTGHGKGEGLTWIDSWEQLQISFSDMLVPAEDREVASIYIECWLLAYNLAMWEACGFRTDDANLDAIRAWMDDNPPPDRSEATALYNLAVTTP